MEVGTVVLLHSPFLSARAWGALPTRLEGLGHDVVVTDVTDDEEPPYAMRYVARAAQQITASRPSAPLVLVGHSAAGPLLPQVGAAQRAARRPVAGYVFLDATLPRGGAASRLDLLAAANPDLADRTRHDLERGGSAPVWTDADLAAAGLDPAAREVARSALRPRGLAFFTEVLPHPDDWPDAPLAYLQTSPAGAAAARVAGLRGFRVQSVGGGHLAALTDPDGVASALHATVIDL